MFCSLFFLCINLNMGYQRLFLSSDVALEEDDTLAGADQDSKRAITYQISRNKGLMPKRKKEQRNPRVKHL